ncbi:AraC family transcriptional regulator [Rhizobium sp. Root1204]|nr:AraC family transcriptional regulator [Rhizobium sp. Root1204]
MVKSDVPDFFVYGEPSRSLDVGFLHVETVMERKTLHFGQVSPHKHPLMGQITFWFKGEGVYKVEDRNWNFSAPAISFVPSNVVHGFEVATDSDAIVVSVSDDMLRAMSPSVDLNLDTPVFVSGQPDDESWSRVSALLEMISAEYHERGGTEGEKVITGLVSVVLSLVGRLGGSVALRAGSPTIALARALRKTVDQRYKEDWPVRRYVEMLATTSHILDKTAKEVFGLTVKEMVIERRSLEARRLLLFTIRSVEDIGREVGFDDPAYFSRFFRMRMGCSPSEWRRAHLKDGGCE